MSEQYRPVMALEHRIPPQRLPEPEWHAMTYAPMDGTEIELLLHHPNHRYASDAEKEQWTAIVKAKWIGFNGGGWTWSGMFGAPMGWRPIAAAPSTAPTDGGTNADQA